MPVAVSVRSSESSTRNTGATSVAANVPLFNPGELAVIVAEPGPMPVTAKLTAEVPDGIVTVDGTVAIDGSLLDRLTPWPPSTALTFMTNVTLRANAEPLKNVAEPGTMLKFTFCTCTAAVVFGYPEALAVIVAFPAATPVTAADACEDPAAIETVDPTVAIPVLEELRLIVTPPGGAGSDKTIWRFVDCDGLTRIAGVIWMRRMRTVTCAVDPD